MPKFSSDYIESLFKNFEEETYKIRSSLAKTNDPDSDEINALIENFSRRKEILEKLDEWLKLEEKDFPSDKKKSLMSLFAARILDVEKQNLDLIENVTNEKAKKLKNLIRNKSILIYTGKKKI